MSDEHDDSIESIMAMTEKLHELCRQRDIQMYGREIPPASIAQIRAETIAMRAENDQLLAERDGAWRTFD